MDEAKKFDDAFVEKYRTDMDIVLISAGLFSLVSAMFIAAMNSWKDPGSTTTWTQSLTYASLATSVNAALCASLARQWLVNYHQTGSGTSEQRALLRQAKHDALEKWKFQPMLRTFSVLPQISLLLFGIALSTYAWTRQSAIAAAVVGATAIGILLYALVTLASIYNRPFLSPLTNTTKYPVTNITLHE
ncbi:hypothetical protein BJ138DRAFT_1092480 [Hygrophoropsis aurantiaca]|uniref:Uncharacterized protein n=1 Tax=Hygrophoropsis aurantiaca TaxID=72124 RepID=A0ACB8A1Z0_9AGAM|nr:hypothetical protein BJ138DRAFT_1092480 [Hygrophoropsis aurantiaca]